MLFVLFVAGAVFSFSQGKTLAGVLATVVAVIDCASAVTLFVLARRRKRRLS